MRVDPTIATNKSRTCPSGTFTPPINAGTLSPIANTGQEQRAAPPARLVRKYTRTRTGSLFGPNLEGAAPGSAAAGPACSPERCGARAARAGRRRTFPGAAPRPKKDHLTMDAPPTLSPARHHETIDATDSDLRNTVGRWVKGRILGRGAVGTVCLAQLADGRRAACKQINTEGPAARAEARAAAGVSRARSRFVSHRERFAGGAVAATPRTWVVL